MKKLTLGLALVLLGVLLSCSDMFAASQQARYIFMQNITSNSATAKWLYNGDGAGRIVVLRTDNSWGATETALGTTTTAFADAAGDLSTATQIGATGSYVVDVHTGSTKQIALTNLAAGTMYSIRIFEWDVDGDYDYLTSNGGFNNPHSFTTLNAIPQPPSLITVDAGNCFFDIEWTPGENANGTIMSLYYDADDDDVCDPEPSGELGTFTGLATPTDWIEIDLGDLDEIYGFPIENFNHDHRVEMWGYNGTVANISSTSTEEDFAPVLDCDGPVATITVNQLIWNDETEEWELGVEVSEPFCVAGDRFRVFISFDEPVVEFEDDDLSHSGGTIVEGSWIASENNEDFQFDYEIEASTATVSIDANDDLATDCVGNFGPGSDPFTFDVDNAAPEFTAGPMFTNFGQETCITTANWTFPNSPSPLGAINTPADVPIEIGFNASDIGCCGDVLPTVNVQVWNNETSEWDFVAELTTGSNGYDYIATYTVTSATPDGDYQFEVILNDCHGNEESWTGLEFSVDQTPPDGYQVECVTVEEETVCTEVTEWDAPCLGAGETLTLCSAIIEEGCGEFNISSFADPGENGLGLFMDPIPVNFSPGDVSAVSGSGTVEDPYIVCVTFNVTTDWTEGGYDIGVWGTDEAGNFSVTVDTDKFFVDLTDPIVDADDLESCYGDVGEDEINFTFEASDLAGCAPLTVTAVWTFADETTLAMSLEESDGFYTFVYDVMSGTTPEGEATLTITATDGAGNETQDIQNTTFDFTSPSLVGEPLLPEDDCLSDGQQFCVTFTVEDLGCGLDFGTESVNWSSYAITANESSEGGSWEITVCLDITTQESGSYDFWYEISDFGGNGFLIDIEDAFSIDNTDPVVTNLEVDDDCVTTTDVVTITFNADDAFTCCVDSFFDVFVDLTFSNSSTASATFVSVVSGSSGGWDYTFTYTVLPANPEGTVLVEAYAVDCAENEGWLDATFQIDRTAPVVSALQVNPNDCVAPGVDINMTFTAEDIGGCGILDCDAAWAVLTFSNSTTVMVDFVEDEGGNCEADIDGATDYNTYYTVGENDPSGPVTVTVFVVDGAGNIGSQQLNNAVTIDNTAPVVENITTDETCVTEEDVVTICFDASDLGCGDFNNANLAVFVFAPNEVTTSATFQSSTGDNYCYTFAISGSETHPSGYYAVSVTAIDEAGNETEETLNDAFQVVHAPVLAEWTVEYTEPCDVTNANPICVDFEFDREVFDFTASDIYVSYGFEVSSVEGEGNSWTVCVSALSGSGTGTLFMYVSEVYDCAGNEYTAYDITAGYDYDAPSGYTASFTDEEGNPIEYINGETCDDVYITITGGVIGEVADWKIEVGEKIYEGSVIITTSPETFYIEGLSLCEDEEGGVDLTVNLSDCVGNTGEDATDEVILDVTPPCVTIDAPEYTNDDYDVTFTWTEDVMGFDDSDIVVTNGSIYDFAGSGADYTVGIAPTSEGLVLISILSSGHGITDLAGNPFDGENSECNDEDETIYDITPPEFDELTWSDDNVELLLYWDEDVMGSSPVELADLALTFVQNGGTATGVTLTAVDHTEGNDWAELTISVTGTPNGCEVIEIRPATGSSVFDLAANAQSVTDMISINLVNTSFPTVQASNGFADNVYASQARLNWTRGDGDAVIVILFEDNDCDVDPVNGVNYYDDNTFGWGSYLSCASSSGGYVVYYGTGTQVTVDYLSGCTNYRAVVYEVIDGDCNNPNYLTPGHEFEFETKPVATELIITHINGVPYEKDCDFQLPSASVFSVTVGLFAYDCDSGEELVPAYLAWEDNIFLEHQANWISLVDETWPISQTSKTFTNIQFGIDNECSNIGNPARDSYFDACCDALFAYMDYDGWLYDDGPLSFRGAEPGQQAYGITFSGTTNSKFNVSWLKSAATTATGEGSLLVIKQGSAVNVFPSDGVVYGAEMGVSTLNFATAGQNIGSGNRALLYQLDCACDETFRPRAVEVTGLNAGTTYYARVFELRYDVDFVNYGSFCQEPSDQEGQGEGCENLALRFQEQENVVKYRTTTGTGNPRSKKTSGMEGMFAGLELIDFDGRSFERKVELVWATASEGGSLGFEIYRADAETFEFVKIANVAGNVNGSTYKLLDDDSRLEVGKTYIYRLSYIAKDGTIEDLSEISVPILTMPNSMQSIYVSQVTPNPVTDFGKLTVEMTTEQNLKIEVRNAAGQLVSVLSDQIRGAGVHNFNIDLTNRAQGSYSILISTDYEAIYVPFMYVK
ncbi:MAG: T9SS type A sorting domain-containing protein [Desulfobulbaceae bacterium]|nr:T9SS type A sorting domain-containing protein [Desulfobulbaceae bacterium]